MLKRLLQMIEVEMNRSLTRFYLQGYEDGMKHVMSDMQKKGLIECVGVSVYDNQDTGEAYIDYEVRPGKLGKVKQ